MKELLLAVVIILGIYVAHRLKNNKVNQLLIHIYNATQNNDEESLFQYLHSKTAKTFISPFTLLFLELKFYIKNHHYDKVSTLVESIDESSLKLKEKQELYFLMFSYNVDLQNLEEIHHYYLKLKDIVKQKELLDEMELIHKVFVDKDPSCVDIISSHIDNTQYSQSLSLLYYYRARLYYFSNHLDKALKDLKKSKELNKNKEWQEKMNAFIHSKCQKMK